MPYLRFWRLPPAAALLLGLLGAGSFGANPSFASELPPADSDALTIEAFPFGHAQLEQLKRDGEVYLEGPYGVLRVALVAANATPSGERLDVSVDGLPGTITRSGSGFFASLPSRHGSLRLESNGNSTRLIDESMLDQRNIPQLRDYRTPVAR